MAAREPRRGARVAYRMPRARRKGERGISGVRGAQAEERRIRTNYVTEAARAACKEDRVKAKLNN